MIINRKFNDTKKSFAQDEATENVSRWTYYEDSRELEKKIKYNIAVATEGFVNSIYDLGEASGWVTASDEEWAQAVYDEVIIGVNFGGSYNPDNSLRFFGKNKIMNLIHYYLDNYSDRLEAIAKHREDKKIN